MRVAVAAVLLAVTAVACGTEPMVETANPESEPPTGLGPWQRLEDPPLTPRSGATIAWTGEEILVIGGSTFTCPSGADCAGPTEPPLRDGAALQPTTGDWRSIAQAPVPISANLETENLDGNVYILVPASNDPGPGADLLRYQPSTDTWNAYEVPTNDHPSGLVATDTSVVVYTGSDEQKEAQDLSFTPATGTWTELPDDPLGPSFDRLYAWTSHGLHLFAKDITPSPGGESGPSLKNAAVLVDGTWRELPTGDTLGFWSVITDGDRIIDPTLGCADGGEVNNYGRCIPLGAVLDTTTGTWAELPDAPDRNAKHVSSSGAFTADEVLLTSTGHPILDLTTNRWLSMPRIDDGDEGGNVERTVTGAGPYGFAFGSVRHDPDDYGAELLGDAWLWTPPAPGGGPTG